jgi:hypothetical protein
VHSAKLPSFFLTNFTRIFFAVDPAAQQALSFMKNELSAEAAGGVRPGKWVGGVPFLCQNP